MNPLVRRLQYGAALDADDRAALTAVTADARTYAAGQDIRQQGEPTDLWNVVLDGFACRYKMLDNGRRQIVAIMAPGDSCDLHGALLDRMDHSIGVLSKATIAAVPHTALDQLVAERPAVARALWWSTLVDEAILREWLVNLGQRSAEDRLAHLLCEVYARLKAVDLVGEGPIPLPLTQIDLADTLGVSPVHVNRVLQKLRADRLIVLERGMLTILDHERLQQRAGFDPEYLHLTPPTRRMFARNPVATRMEQASAA